SRRRARCDHSRTETSTHGRGVSLVLDAGALVALERSDRDVIALVKRELLAGRVPATHGGVVGQVWRGGTGRQANLARVLPGVERRTRREEPDRQAQAAEQW